MNILTRVKNSIRSFFSHWFINTFWHWPISYLAVFLYGNPGKQLTLIGVTGTDGKTTTVNLIYHILKQAGYQTSMISSVKAVIGKTEYDTGFHVTSPHPFAVQRLLKQAAKQKSRYMVLEVTSHGLAQHRFSGLQFDVGVLTNVTHEHLDYHHTYQEYLKTKMKLLQNAIVSVVNKDDNSYRLLSTSIHEKEITYGLKDADITPRKFPHTSPLLGKFNAYNILASIAVAKHLQISDADIRRALKQFPGVKGRMEIVYDKEIRVIIDFAHTPHSFEQILTAVSDTAKKRVIHVFGCAGLRDAKKRPLMGSISAQFADHIVLTEEDYRIEDINRIMDEIEQGIKGEKPVDRIPNRKEAIFHAIALAKPGDTVLLTGKAHEKSLCRDDTEYPWDEFKAVQDALHARNEKKK